MLRSKLHCLTGLNLIPFSYKIAVEGLSGGRCVQKWAREEVRWAERLRSSADPSAGGDQPVAGALTGTRGERETTGYEPLDLDASRLIPKKNEIRSLWLEPGNPGNWLTEHTTGRDRAVAADEGGAVEDFVRELEVAASLLRSEVHCRIRTPSGQTTNVYTNDFPLTSVDSPQQGSEHDRLPCSFQDISSKISGMFFSAQRFRI